MSISECINKRGLVRGGFRRKGGGEGWGEEGIEFINSNILAYNKDTKKKHASINTRVSTHTKYACIVAHMCAYLRIICVSVCSNG